MLGDHRRIVHVIHRQHLHRVVVIQKIIDLLGTHGKGQDRLSPVDGLAAVVRRAAFHQLHQTVRQQLRMDA